ncbi:hypothetical protein [Endothiovibrio diazotrophicus]
MNKLLIIVGTIAGAVLLIPIVSYISMYGYHLSDSQELWAQFGDFFGGLLNPIYALLAFLALLYTISLQSAELRQATTEFRRSADSMQQQLDHYKDAAKKEDLYKIIKDIDDDLEKIYETVVSPEGQQPVLNIGHMVHEGFRLRNTPEKSGSYKQFLAIASSSGSVVESVFLRLALASVNLYKYLIKYQELAGGENYVSEYYRYKYFMLGQLLKDAGNIDDDICEYYLSSVARNVQQGHQK